jgi:hypothetical protein
LEDAGPLGGCHGFSLLRWGKLQGKVPAVANPHDHPTALKDLQDSIYREKVLRARAMTPEERFNSGFEVTNEAFQRMLEGAMWQLDIQDVSEGWNEVSRRLHRLRTAQELGRYTSSRSH